MRVSETKGPLNPALVELHELTNFLPCERLYASSVRGNRCRPAGTGYDLAAPSKTSQW
jgi:hypothetical protein